MTTPHDTAFVVRVVESPTEVQRHQDHRVPVLTHLNHGDLDSVKRAVEQLNAADLAVIQHEYGIYGGTDGNQVLEVMAQLTAPTIVVLHTVLSRPTLGQRQVLEQVVRLASAVVVMSDAAQHTLLDQYRVGRSQVTVIPHGVDVEAESSDTSHDQHDGRESERPVILTWGLLGPGKGIETGITALQYLSDLDPLPLYRVLGQTHPKVVAHQGEAYRAELMELAISIGVQSMVDIDGQYLGSQELGRALTRADVVLLPYQSRSQVTSGVLAEAVAAGKPVVATAFPHAVEMLGDGAGTVVPHEDAEAMAVALREILTHREIREQMSRLAKNSAVIASWPAVGARYRRLAQHLQMRAVAS